MYLGNKVAHSAPPSEYVNIYSMGYRLQVYSLFVPLKTKDSNLWKPIFRKIMKNFKSVNKFFWTLPNDGTIYINLT